jgi:hypothetical protein
MFKSLDELIRFKQSQFQVWREASIRWATGILGAAAGFQAVYALLVAFE